MYKNYYNKTSQNSPRNLSQKCLKLKLNKTQLSKLNLTKPLNLNLMKIKRRNKANNDHNLSNGNCTNILNAFTTTSFDSNKTLRSDHSLKSICLKDNSDNNIEFLKDIQIKESSIDNETSFQCKPDDFNNNVSFNQTDNSNTLGERKNNKIWISMNISTIYNKGNNAPTKYYHKKSDDQLKGQGRNEKEFCKKDIEMHTTSDNCVYNNDEHEKIRLKKKITELLEINSMLVNSRQELEKEKATLITTIYQLKAYITDNKIEDIISLQNKLKESNKEITKCHEIIKKFQKNKDSTQNYSSTNHCDNIRIKPINQDKTESLFTSNKSKEKKISRVVPFDNYNIGLNQFDYNSKLSNNMPKVNKNKRKQEKRSNSNQHSYDLELNDI